MGFTRLFVKNEADSSAGRFVCVAIFKSIYLYVIIHEGLGHGF